MDEQHKNFLYYYDSSEGKNDIAGLENANTSKSTKRTLTVGGKIALVITAGCLIFLSCLTAELLASEKFSCKVS